MRLKKWLPSLAFALMSLSLQAQSDIESANQAFLVREYQKAITLYEQGLAKSPTDAEAQSNLAICYFITNQPQKAVDWFAKALKHPDMLSKSPLLPYHYGEALKMTGKYEEAKAAYKMLPTEQSHLVNLCLASADFAVQHAQMKPVFIVRNEMAINSESADYAPSFYKNKVYFNSARPVFMPLLQSYSGSDYNWLYTSNRNLSSGLLSGAANLFQNNNFEQHANGAPAAFSEDGKTVAYMLNSLSSGVRHLPYYNLRSGEIALAKVLAADNWANDDARAFSHFKNMDGVSVGFPVLSPDGNALYFSANPNTALGGFDIFVSFYQNGQWQAPQNLGYNVNSHGDEFVSAIADDGTLYFSSNFHQGFGGYDIFSATLEAEGNAKVWRNVRNLGPSVNSTADDMYFIYDTANKYAYFASNREGGKGDFDIYSAQLVGDFANLPLAVSNEKNDIVLHYPNQPDPTPAPEKDPIKTTPGKSDKDKNIAQKTTPNKTTPATNDPDDVPCGLDVYIGAILDGVNKQPVADAVVYIKNLRTDTKTKATTNKYGEYSIQLEPLTEYLIVASKNGYQNETFQVDTKTRGQRTLLGQRYLQRAGTSSEVDIFGDPIYPENPSPSPQKITPYAKSTSTNFSPATPDKTIPDTGYVVQIGAFSKLNDDMLMKLSQHGNVLTEKGKNGATVYRLGVYADRLHADRATAEAKKLGFEDAWKIKTPIDNKSFAGKLAANAQVIFPYDPNTAANPVAENTDLPFDDPNFKLTPTSEVLIRETSHDSWADNNKVASRSLKTTTTPSTTADNNKIQKNQPQSNPIQTNPASFSNGLEFRIQLGAFREPEKASFANLKDLAPIEAQMQGNGLTYFYLGSFPTLDAAQNIKAKAEARGAQQPFVVAFRNGKRIPLADAK